MVVTVPACGRNFLFFSRSHEGLVLNAKLGRPAFWRRLGIIWRGRIPKEKAGNLPAFELTITKY
jgi:hypothetical protein